MLNNPYVPGDPYSYDLKWLVAKVKEILAQLGTLDEAIEAKIFEGFLEHSIIQFKNVAEMLAAEITDGSIVLTLGYHEPGDQGGLFYLVKDFNPSQCSLDYFLTMDNDRQIAIPVIMTPYVTPEMFGAYGDGLQDDSDPVQKAITIHEQILFPAGKEYVITKQIELDSDKYISGEGTILDRWTPDASVQDPSGLFDATGKENIRFSDITVRGTGAGGTGIATQYKEEFSFNQCKNISFSNVKVYDSNAIMVVRFNGCDGASVEDCHIERYSYSGVANVQGSDHLLVKNCRIIDCMNVDANNTYPIMLHGYEFIEQGQKHGTDLKAINNYISNSLPHWESIDAHGGYDILVEGNVCENVADGIAVFSDEQRYFYVKNAVIRGNIVKGATVGTIRDHPFCGITGGGDGFIIENNILENCGALSSATHGGAIYYRYGSDTIIRNNVIKNAYCHAISSTGYVKNLVISGNIIDGLIDTANADSGYALYLTTGKYGHVEISNNVFKGITKYYELSPSPILDVANGYVPHIIYKDNVFGEMDQTTATMFPRFLPNYCVPQFTVGVPTFSNIAQGYKGDIIKEQNPVAGQPLGWICTKSYDGTTGATWVALPSI